MARPSCEALCRLVQVIRDANWPDQVLTYFGKARTDRCAVNPYWPRAFLLTLAGLYLRESPPYRYVDQHLISWHIGELDAVAPADKGMDTVQWILDLPNVYRALRAHAVLPRLWDLYEASIDLGRCDAVTAEAVSMILQPTGTTSDRLPNLVIIPNPLQAPELTDSVTLRDKVYLIKAEPDAASCVHEMLHHLLSPAVGLSRPTISEFTYLLAPVREDMLRLGYAWDDTEESWCRVFEEHLIRAAQIWIICGGDPASAEHASACQAGYGFKYLPAIMRHFQSKWSGIGSIEDFIAQCLHVCREYQAQE